MNRRQEFENAMIRTPEKEAEIALLKEAWERRQREGVGDIPPERDMPREEPRPETDDIELLEREYAEADGREARALKRRLKAAERQKRGKI